MVRTQILKTQTSTEKKRRETASGCQAEKAQGQRRRQEQRPRQRQQLPDHMIADRRRGAAEKGCMQIRQSAGQRKNVRREKEEERTERTQRGYSTMEKRDNTKNEEWREDRKWGERAKRKCQKSSGRVNRNRAEIRLRDAAVSENTSSANNVHVEYSGRGVNTVRVKWVYGTSAQTLSLCDYTYFW